MATRGNAQLVVQVDVEATDACSGKTMWAVTKTWISRLFLRLTQFTGHVPGIE